MYVFDFMVCSHPICVLSYKPQEYMALLDLHGSYGILEEGTQVKEADLAGMVCARNFHAETVLANSIISSSFYLSFKAGGGIIGGACAKAGIDLEFSWVFTDDNIYNAGGHSLGGELEVKIGGGGEIVSLHLSLNVDSNKNM